MLSQSSSAAASTITVSEPCPMSFEPVPETKPEPAKPMPSPLGNLPRFSFQPIASSTRSSVSVKAQLVILRPLGECSSAYWR